MRERRTVRAGLAGLLILLAALPCLVHAAPRIGVLTMGPGAEYWSRYGHNALLVEDDEGRHTVYNYGFFDFDQPGFLLRFAQGRMRYRLVAQPFEQELAYYRQEGRGMRLQWLRLAPQQAAELARLLEWNARPENAEYRYDYFTANCSTKVRDALDRVLGGRIKEQTRGRSRGLSYRSEALRLAAPDLWMYLGIHLFLGPAADRPLSRWEESFVPARLHDALALVKLADGQALVEEELSLLPQVLPEARAEEPRFLLLATLAGGALAVLVLLLPRRAGPAGRFGRGLLGLFWLGTGLVGVVGLLLWFATDHLMAHGNRTLLLCTPAGLLLLPALRTLAADRRPTPFAGGLAGAAALLATLTVPLYMLPVRPQDHLEWIVLLLPVHLAAWRLLSPAEDPVP